MCNIFIIMQRTKMHLKECCIKCRALYSNLVLLKATWVRKASLRTSHQEVIIRPADPALTNKSPFPGSDAHTISGAG